MPTEEFPKFVFKAFGKEKYARDFVEAGRIRLGALRQYQNIEDANRRDSTEGEAHVQFQDIVKRIHFVPDSAETFISEGPGTMHTRSSLGNSIFLFCTSLPEVDTDLLRQRFGKFLVRIEKSMQLAIDIQRAMESADRALIGRVLGARVEYTKGDLVARDPSPSEGARLSYTQKPIGFSAEHEFRFVAIIGGAVRAADLPQFIDLDLGGHPSYAKLL